MGGNFFASLLALLCASSASAFAGVAVGGVASRGQRRSSSPLAFFQGATGSAGRLGSLGGSPAAARGPQQPRVAHILMQEKDYYAILGVPRGSSEADIKKAYRTAARKWHPDVSKEPDAQDKFRTINEAYQVLSSKEMRARYDQFGMAGVKEGGGGGPNMQDFDLGDIFESFFTGQQGGARQQQRTNRPTQGDDLRFDLELDFKTVRSIRHFYSSTSPDDGGSSWSFPPIFGMALLVVET